MKIREGFLMHQISGQMVVLPTGGELDLNMMITLNETGAFLWELLRNDTNEEALLSALLAEYDVDEAVARKCVSEFLKKLDENGFLE